MKYSFFSYLRVLIKKIIKISKQENGNIILLFKSLSGNKCNEYDETLIPFNDAMVNDARLVMSVVIDKCKRVFEGLESLVDVGGGIETAANAIADEFPNLKCTVLDLPQVVADLQGTDENLIYLGGNMFEAIPPADGVLLKVNLFFELIPLGTFICMRN